MRFVNLGRSLAGIGVCLLLLTACGPAQAPADPTADASSATATLQTDPATAINAALTSSERFAGDAEEDAGRHPVEVLGFLGVEPGMRVLDVLAGGGYYTELLSRVVGADGTVIAHNNALFDKFFGDKLTERLAGGRLANVRRVSAEANDLSLEGGELDGALFIMCYHDLYHKAEAGTTATDVRALVTRLYQSMKPGGIVLVQDHVANPGGDTVEIADTLHRIDPETVKQDFAAAGFTFDGDNAALANPGDDHAKPVFDASIRGRTDRFMMRFRRPVPSEATADTPRLE